jgi:hypothetical protein
MRGISRYFHESYLTLFFMRHFRPTTVRIFLQKKKDLAVVTPEYRQVLNRAATRQNHESHEESLIVNPISLVKFNLNFNLTNCCDWLRCMEFLIASGALVQLGIRNARGTVKMFARRQEVRLAMFNLIPAQTTFVVTVHQCKLRWCRSNGNPHDDIIIFFRVRVWILFETFPQCDLEIHVIVFVRIRVRVAYPTCIRD